MSSIKRDLGIKDMAATIPGHGGLLDRFDSLLFVGPAMFHYLAYFDALKLDLPVRIFSGGH
jgi:phosphatidate cytidylyltransferase